MLSLVDRRILLTGASRGLGAVCAASFAGMGARLALLARTPETLEKVRADCSHPRHHCCIPADLNEPSAIDAAVAEAQDFLGGIDAVLHVAGGGLGLRDPLIAHEDLLRILVLNVAAAAAINKLVAPSMVKHGRGNLVHVGSISGSEANASVGYNTAKAALAAYVRSLGNALAGTGVVVTGILPGGFLAPGNSWERLNAQKPEVVKQFVATRLPRGRLAEATELIPLLAFLCSDAASMMAGCMVPIDAGEGRTYTWG